MTEAFKREKVFRDPVRLYPVQPIILELINSRELQRLREDQTGASMYTFRPGGTLTFSRSLGILIVRRIWPLCT